MSALIVAEGLREVVMEKGERKKRGEKNYPLRGSPTCHEVHL
jgi:hypothetical protein